MTRKQTNPCANVCRSRSSVVASESAPDAGSFGSRLHDGGDGLDPVFGEVLEALDDPQSHPAQQRQRRVPARGERLRRIADMGPTLVLVAGHVSDVMQTVLDPPVFSRQCQQRRRSGLSGGEGGDCEHRLDGLLAAHNAFARDATYLADAFPRRRQQVIQRGRRLDPARFNPTVTFLDRLGSCQVRGRRPRRRGGEMAGRPALYRPSMLAGCLSP